MLAHKYNLDKEDPELYIVAVPTILNMLDAKDVDKAEAFYGETRYQDCVLEFLKQTAFLADKTVIPTYQLF